MIYSDLYQRKEQKIPSVFAVLIIGVISFFMTQFLITPTRTTQATKQNIIDLKTTNVGSRHATVVWRTSNKEQGMVFWGTASNKLDRVAQDERDSGSSQRELFNHSVPLNELQPSTKYYYQLSNTKEILRTGSTSVFSFKTAPADSRINSLKPIYGTVTSPIGVKRSNVLVIFTFPGANPISSISKNSGEWLLPLNSLNSSSTGTLLSPSTTDTGMVTFFDEEGNSAKVSSPIELLSPVNQSVQMGKTYTLPEETQVLGTSSAQMVIAQSKPSPTPSTSSSLSVSYPIQNAVLSVGSPLIKGSSSPFAIVSVTIRALTGSIKAITRTASADKTGAWKLTLTQNLPAGGYTLSAAVEGVYPTVSRNFTVTKSGERVLGEATGSAELTTTPTKTPTPTPSDEPQPTLPKTGTTNDYLIYSSAAFIVMGLGLLFVF